MEHAHLVTQSSRFYGNSNHAVQRESFLRFFVNVFVATGLGRYYTLIWIGLAVWGGLWTLLYKFIITQSEDLVQEVLTGFWPLEFFIPFLYFFVINEAFQNFLTRPSGFFRAMSAFRTLNNEIYHWLEKIGYQTCHLEHLQFHKDNAHIVQVQMKTINVVMAFALHRVYANYADVVDLDDIESEMRSTDDKLQNVVYNEIQWHEADSLHDQLTVIEREYPQLWEKMKSIIKSDRQSNQMNYAADEALLLLEETILLSLTTMQNIINEMHSTNCDVGTPQPTLLLSKSSSSPAIQFNTQFITGKTPLVYADFPQCPWPRIKTPLGGFLPASMDSSLSQSKAILQSTYISNYAIFPSIFLYCIYFTLFIYFGFMVPFRLHVVLGWSTFLVYPTVVMMLCSLIITRQFIGNEMIYNAIVNIDYESAMLSVIAQAVKKSHSIAKQLNIEN